MDKGRRTLDQMTGSIHSTLKEQSGTRPGPVNTCGAATDETTPDLSGDHRENIIHEMCKTWCENVGPLPDQAWDTVRDGMAQIYAYYVAPREERIGRIQKNANDCQDKYRELFAAITKAGEKVELVYIVGHDGAVAAIKWLIADLLDNRVRLEKLVNHTNQVTGERDQIQKENELLREKTLWPGGGSRYHLIRTFEYDQLIAAERSLVDELRNEAGKNIKLGANLQRVAAHTMRHGGATIVTCNGTQKYEITVNGLPSAITPTSPEAAEWVVHVLGPDDVIPQPDELAALRCANATNKMIWSQERHQNDPLVVALVKNRRTEAC